jgi:hypothetical protein
MAIGTPTNVTIVVTKNTDGSMSITSGDAAATGWVIFRPSYSADSVDDYTSIKNPVWSEVLRQIRVI